MIHSGKKLMRRYIVFVITIFFFISSSCASAHYETNATPRYAVASWYGPDFHGRPTASGEVYDMNAFTCAHREYPFGKKVRDISNIDLVTIQVGSFKEIANATRLKMALELKYDKIYITETDINGNRYYRVRVGTFRIRGEALRLAKSLADEGYDTLITNYEEKI